MKHLLLIASLLVASTVLAQPGPAPKKSGKSFSDTADSALVVMSGRAQELKVSGVGLVAYIEGDSVTAWSSKMIVVGSLKKSPAGKDRGSNLLAIAYAKAAEMADTLKDSGNAGRPPMTGETGWQGGLIRQVSTGYLIAAFSGGPSESDLKIAQVGLDFMATHL